MAELKTQPTDASVEAFLAAVADPARRDDCRTLLELMTRATGEPARMWGASMVGFGAYHYRYASGRQGNWFLAGFSPRRNDLTVYVMAGFERYQELMDRLGKHETGKSCLYLKRLCDVDLAVLEELVAASAAQVASAHAR
jgi:hypothetical protein